MSLDAVVIGGGPAGAAVGRLLASWGHTVRILAAPPDRSRGLAESLPPSVRKLLAEIGVLEAVDAAGFLRGSGNTSWWASADPRTETFDTPGYQIFRPDFDRVLLESARAAGADLRTATVRRVDLGPRSARVEYDEGGQRTTVSCRFAIDCSGRAGVIARRFRQGRDARMFGYVGVWRNDDGWTSHDATQTVVETFDDGWAWSIATSATARHVGVMVGEPGSDYATHLAKTRAMQTLLAGASLTRTFACDASTYSASCYAGDRFVLVGDAASFIDPLSSFGVKKALASAWLGAIAIHTALTHPDRRAVAFDFFSNREREMEAAHRRAAREFAREAYSRHASAFWERRCGADAETTPARDESDVAAVFERFKASAAINLQLADRLPLESRPVVRGREIVLEPALAGGLRFVGNVDLLKLAEMAPRHHQVPDLFDAYCRDCSPVPLPSVVSGLSLLVAKGILYER